MVYFFNIQITGSTSPYQFSVDGINWSAGQSIYVDSIGTYTLYVKDNTGSIFNYGSVTIDNQSNIYLGYVPN